MLAVIRQRSSSASTFSEEVGLNGLDAKRFLRNDNTAVSFVHGMMVGFTSWRVRMVCRHAEFLGQAFQPDGTAIDELHRGFFCQAGQPDLRKRPLPRMRPFVDWITHKL